MATRFLDKEFGVDSSTAIANDTTGTRKVKDLPDAAGIVIDKVDGFIKYNDGGTIRELVNLNEAQTLTNKVFGTSMTAGAGVAGAETYESSVVKEGSLIVTRIVVDLTDLVGSTTDLDIIGDSAAASANFGQITAAVNGTIVGGKVTCLEVPAGGADDIDFYSATVGTGAENDGIAALTETALVTSGGAWTSGASKGMTAVPPANDYLYIVNGEAAVPGTFTAGKFLIEFYGA